MRLLALTLTPEQWDAILNAIVLIVIGILGRFGIKVAREGIGEMKTTTVDQTTRIVERLYAIDGRLDNHEQQLTEISGKANGIAETATHIEREIVNP